VCSTCPGDQLSVPQQQGSLPRKLPKHELVILRLYDNFKTWKEESLGHYLPQMTTRLLLRCSQNSAICFISPAAFSVMYCMRFSGVFQDLTNNQYFPGKAKDVAMLNTRQLSQSVWNFIIERKHTALTRRDITCQITKPCNGDIRISLNKGYKESFRWSAEWDFLAAQVHHINL